MISWVRFVLRPLIGLLYQPHLTDDEYEAVHGMIDKGNQSSVRILFATEPTPPGPEIEPGPPK
jgi:hypothetical protein